jgi:hemerythrin
MMEGDPETIKRLSEESLMQMIDYARYHFISEEKYMREIGYPDVDAHTEIHREFTNQLDEQNEMIQSGHMVLSTTLLGIIKNWLFDHIMSVDKKIGRFAASSRT